MTRSRWGSSGKMGSDDEGVISLFGVKIDDCLKGLSKRPIFCGEATSVLEAISIDGLLNELYIK